MNLLQEDAVRQLIAAVQGTNEPDPFADDLAMDFPVDPVARITEPEEQESTVPAAIAPPVQDTLDMMTTSPKEKRIADKTFKQSTPGSSAAFQAAQAATGIPTTGQFVRRMLAKEGLPYQWGSTGQPDPASGRKAFDCSGIIYRIMQNFGFSNFPRVSGDIINHAKPISVKKAMKTRGAVLWTDGHIAVSLGNGKTIEARGEDYGVVIADAAGRFTKGGLLPELEQGRAPQEAKSSRKKKGNGQRIRLMPSDPLNKIDSVSSLTQATTVFGSLIGEMQQPGVIPEPGEPRGKTVTAKGLKFVPKQYRSWIVEAAEKSGLSPRLIAYVMQKESGFSADVVNFQRDSSAGARGPMQIMPFWESTYGNKIFTDPRANVIAGAKILASYIEQQDGNLRRGLASYNAGPGNMSAGMGYAQDILDLFLGRAA